MQRVQMRELRLRGPGRIADAHVARGEGRPRHQRGQSAGFALAAPVHSEVAGDGEWPADRLAHLVVDERP
jgi:hypothetical protein